MKQGSLCFIFIVFVSLAAFSQGTFLPPSFTKLAVPFSLNQEGEILLPGKVGEHPVELMLDTGMDAPVGVSLSSAQTAHLVPESQTATLHLFGEAEDRPASVLSDFSLSLQETPFRVDRGLLLHTLQGFSDHPESFHAVLGWGFLQRFRVILDYPGKTLTLVSPLLSEEAFPPDPGIRLTDRRLPVVAGKLKDHDIRLLLDTASPQSWIAYEFLSDTLQEPFTARPDGDLKGFYTARSLKVDHVSVQNLSFNVMGNFSRHARTESFQGILGLNFLRSVTLQLDQVSGLAAVFPGSWKPSTSTTVGPSGGAPPRVR